MNLQYSQCFVHLYFHTCTTPNINTLKLQDVHCKFPNSNFQIQTHILHARDFKHNSTIGHSKYQFEKKNLCFRNYIYEMYKEFFVKTCEEDTKACQWIKEQLVTNDVFVRSQVTSKGNSDPFWHQVGLIYQQMDGIAEGRIIF